MDDHSDLIVADGQSDVEAPPQSPRSGRGPWVLLGLAVGLGIAGLFASSAGRSIAPDTTEETTTSTTVDGSSPTVGLGEVIAGFPDGLNVLVSPGGGRAFEVVTWPVGGPAIRRSIPLGDRTTLGSARFDASGHYLAALVDDGNGGESLMAGQVNSFSVIDGQVSGFAWHDGSAADLAWTAADVGVVSLLVSEDGGSAEPRVVVEDLVDDIGLTAFGDWGFALSTRVTGVFESPTDPITRVLGRDGEEIASFVGLVLDSHASGLLLLDDRVGASVVIVDVSGPEPIESPLPGLARQPFVGTFSPDATRLALSGQQGLEVVDIGSGDQLGEYPVRIGNGPTRWSSDGRFLIVPGFRGILVIDTESGEIHTLLENDGTRAAAPTPIGGSG